MLKNVAGHLTPAGSLDRRFLEQLAYNEKMAELGKLAAGIVHELNTPLSVIVSASQMILREQELSEFVREMVDRIGEEAQRLAQMSKGVLSFARQDQGSEREIDVNEVVREVLLFLRYEAQKRSIRVVEELDFHLAPVVAERNYLKQVLINLVMNACQAMGEGGTLLLRTTETPDHKLLIQVADTGSGIKAADLSRIFEPYFSTKAPDEGTGLGLYITRQLVGMLGGEIAVESVEREGTTFSIRLPH